MFVVDQFVQPVIAGEGKGGGPHGGTFVVSIVATSWESTIMMQLIEGYTEFWDIGYVSPLYESPPPSCTNVVPYLTIYSFPPLASVTYDPIEEWW